MKTGLIVYVLGQESRSETFNETQARKTLDHKTDQVAFVFSGEGEESLIDAWMRMTSKGMANITCMAGAFTPPSTVRLTDRTLQLRGL